MTGVIFFVALMSVGLGAVLLALGLQGRRVNNHPLCRRCRFDLVGAPTLTGACPECGADLAKPRTIRHGERRRGWRMTAAGAVLAGLPLALLGLMFVASRGKGIDHYTPLRVLLWEATHTSDEHRTAIAKEITNRFAGKALDTQGRRAVIATALALQANRRIAWSPEWGGFVDDARLDRVLAEADDAQFRTNALGLTCRQRPMVRAGDPLPVLLEGVDPRTGSNGQLLMIVTLKQATIDGVRAERADPGPAYPRLNGRAMPRIGALGIIMASGNQAPTGEAGFNLVVPPGAPPGRHVCELTVMTRVVRMDGYSLSPRDVLGAQGPDAKAHDEGFEFTVLPPGVDSVSVTAASPETTEAISRSLGELRVSGYAMPGDTAQISLMIDFAHVPAPLACEVLLRDAGEVWPLGSIASGRHVAEMGTGSGSSTFRSAGGLVRDLSSGVYDLVLRPRPEVARQTIDQTSLYGGEIVVHGVKVQIKERP